MISILKSFKRPGPEYAETFARTTRTIDSDWGCRPFVYSEVARIIKGSGKRVGGLIADIGGGEGKVARDLRDIGILDTIVSFDIDSGMIQKAQQEERFQPRGIKIFQGDALHIPLPDHRVILGLRILVDGHWSCSEMDQGNLELARVLMPNGMAIVAIPEPYAYIEQTKMGKHTPGVVVHNETLEYSDEQCVNLTLSNTQGRSVDIPAKMHTLERYRQSLEDSGLSIVEDFVPELDEKELKTYREAWGEEARPFRYRLFVLKKKPVIQQIENAPESY